MKKITLNAILPSTIYLCFLLLVFSKASENIPPIIMITSSLAAPLITWVKTQNIVQKNQSHLNTWAIYLLLAIPGLLFGIHLTYGFFEMGHGENIVGAVAPIALISALSGLFSSFLGKATLDKK